MHRFCRDLLNQAANRLLTRVARCLHCAIIAAYRAATVRERACSCLLLAVLSAAASAQTPTLVDAIWSARWVVTMDTQRRVIENAAVAISGDHIVDVSTRSDIDRRYSATQRLDRPDAILAPGLINTHTHAAMSLFRGIADDMKLQDWLQKFIFPAEAKNVDREFVRWGTRLAVLEMALSGTTTYADMYYFEDTVAEVTKQAGLRGMLGETIIGFPAPDFKTPRASLAATEKFFKDFANDALVIPAVAPHAIYTVPDDTLKQARALANRYQKPLVIHLSETKSENEEALAKRKKTPTATRVALGLGTDGVAGYNNDHNKMAAMDLAAKLQNVITGDPRALPAKQAFELATITGARALHMEKTIGSIEKDKRADMITVSLTAADAVPLYNVYSQFVSALKGADIRDVMVDGRLIVRDRKMLTLDVSSIMLKAAEYQERVKKSMGMN